MQPSARTALPNVSVLLFEVFQNKVTAEVTVKVTPSGMHVVVPWIVELNEVFLGLNPKILNPMNDILFDEKIAGSLHFTPGQAYEDCGNGNKSAVHWDMVLIQRPEWGGGEVWFDGKLIRKDGLFIPKSLQKLNPENLT